MAFKYHSSSELHQVQLHLALKYMQSFLLLPSLPVEAEIPLVFNSFIVSRPKSNDTSLVNLKTCSVSLLCPGERGKLSNTDVNQPVDQPRVLLRHP